jgi:hypothetical protein
MAPGADQQVGNTRGSAACSARAGLICSTWRSAMIVPTQPFRPNQRIRFKDGIHPSFTQGFGRVGNEAVVQQVSSDKFGYPQVYVAWDHDHWSYNGTQDGWYWSNHFEAIPTQRMRWEPIAESVVPLGTTDGNLVALLVDSFTESILQVAKEATNGQSTTRHHL